MMEGMYLQNSTRGRTQGYPPNIPKQSPTVPVSGVKQSPSASSLPASFLSPNRSRGRRSTSSNHGSRSGSPLTLPPTSENHQYYADGVASPVVSSPSRSPFQSPAHSRSSSMTSMKSVLRDRSLDRTLSDTGPGLPRDQLILMESMNRDRSLDRHLDRYRERPSADPRYATFGGQGHRDRSLDREKDFPHMGARSLERDNPSSNLTRSRSIDYDYLVSQSQFMPMTDFRSRDTLILDMQAQITERNKECASLHQELDLAREKVSSSMNSIKTFWSPELKKERALRKEENAKLNSLQDQLRVSQIESKRHQQTIKQLEEHQNGGDHQASTPDSETSTLPKDRQKKEMVLLRRTVDEMELRIETQKQTLTARDESIKRLLEMLQSKGLARGQLDDDRLEADQLRAKNLENEQRLRKLEAMLEAKDREIFRVKEDLTRNSHETRQIQTQCDQAKRQSSNLDTLQTLLDSKEGRLQALERELKMAEDELLRLREEGISVPRMRNHSSSAHPNDQFELQSLKSQEKLLKAKLENSKAECARKDTEVYALRTQMDVLQKQIEDHQQHIRVLREQITAKEQQTLMLQTDMDLVRDRVKDKEELLDRKARHLVALQTEKKRVENDLAEMQDNFEGKEKKTAMLQRKVDGLEEMLQDKERQLMTAQSRLSSLTEDQSSSDNVLSSLEDSLREKDHQIDRLKEARNRLEKEKEEETALSQRSLRELRAKVEGLQHKLQLTQTELVQLKQTATEAKSELMSKEAHIKQLEIQNQQRIQDFQQLQDTARKVEEDRSSEVSRVAAEGERRLKELDEQVDQYKGQVSKCQAEVDRLLQILKQSETEKQELEAQVKALREQMKDSQQKMGTLKRNQQSEKQKILDEATKQQTDESSQMKTLVRDKSDRIEELEEALRESVRITANRELVMAQQEQQLAQAEKQLRAMREDISHLESSRDSQDERSEMLCHQMDEKEAEIKRLQNEKNHQLADVYEMKQEAISAAISEKDAHIALLELASNKRTENITEVEKLTRDKRLLQKQLKELTQFRIKLLQNGDESDTELAKRLQNAPREQR